MFFCILCDTLIIFATTVGKNKWPLKCVKMCFFLYAYLTLCDTFIIFVTTVGKNKWPLKNAFRTKIMAIKKGNLDQIDGC